jgi:hypothetical protein
MRSSGLRYRAISLLAPVSLLACAPALRDAGAGLPGDLVREDAGTIAGSWREVLRNGERVRGGYAITISNFGTFAVQKGCLATGGTLEPLGNGRYRIGRYESGFRASEECPPWRADPQLAPFDGTQVALTRHGDRLLASEDGRAVELRRITLRRR